MKNSVWLRSGVLLLIGGVGAVRGASSTRTWMGASEWGGGGGGMVGFGGRSAKRSAGGGGMLVVGCWWLVVGGWGMEGVCECLLLVCDSSYIVEESVC